MEYIDKSAGELLNYINGVPRNGSFENAAVDKSKAQKGSDVKNHSIMAALPQSAEADFLLESFNVESLSVVLLLIPAISWDKARISVVEVSFAVGVCEVEFFQVVYEYVFRNVLDARDVSTNILWEGWVKSLSGSMGHYFFSPGAIFGPDRAIMVALDPKNEKAFSSNHAVIGFLVLVKLLQIGYISSNIACEDNQ